MIPKHWDATALRSMVCPRRYQLEIAEGYRLARPGPTGPVEAGNHHLKFGTLMHSALERWDALVAAPGPLTAERMEKIRLEVLRHVLRESWGWVSDDKSKNRRTLVRAVVWYMLDQGGGRTLIPAIREDGRPMLETQLKLPLGITRADGEEFVLVANIDGIKQWGPEVFAHERKTTKSYLGRGYWARFAINPQPDTYALVASKLWQDAVSGVLMEAVQTGVQFARWERRPMTRTPRQMEEWRQEVIRTIRDAEAYDMEFGSTPWPMRRSACGLDGGCPFRKVCSLPASVRQGTLEADYVKRPHDALHPGGRSVEES